MTAYYNEIDPAAAHILRAQIAAGTIAPGDVDTRSIKKVSPDDLAGYTQCHFFAGGGLWSVAARLAGWPDDRPLWTGSCPCQPFSAAGKGLGTDDPRHLWPDFHRLIRACRPAVVMGEQVAGKAGYGWFDGVRSDLAREDYAGRAVDFPACSVDAPHQRNRLYWIAVEHAESVGRGKGRAEHELRGWWPTPACADASIALGHGATAIPREHAGERRKPVGRSGFHDREGVPLGDAFGTGLEGQRGHGDRGDEPGRVEAGADGRATAPDGCGGSFGISPDAAGARRNAAAQTGIHREAQGERARHGESQRSSRPDRRNGTYWSDAEWIACHDGKARRAQSGIRFLVDGLPGRVDLWRVGGNAIVPEAAAEVIAAFMDIMDERA